MPNFLQSSNTELEPTIVTERYNKLYQQLYKLGAWDGKIRNGYVSEAQRRDYKALHNLVNVDPWVVNQLILMTKEKKFGRIACT